MPGFVALLVEIMELASGIEDCELVPAGCAGIVVDVGLSNPLVSPPNNELLEF